MTSRRFALVAASLSSALQSRYALLSALHKKGHRILCIAPETADQTQAKNGIEGLSTLGGEWRPISYDTLGLGILNGLRVQGALKNIFSEWRPDCVLGVGADVLCHSAMAAKRAKVPRIVNLCNELPDFLKPIVVDSGHPTRNQFRRALSLSDVNVFHNCDHQRLMVDQGLVPSGANSVVVAGRGVDLDAPHDVLGLPDLSHGLVFLMAARLEAVRGVLDFIQAARRVSSHARAAKFLLLGTPGRDEMNPTTLGFHGAQFEIKDGEQDLAAALARAHVFVYPSHSEGMPQQVLEALAAGRPVITTDTPGCRDTIDETVNGYLVPRGDVGSLVAAMHAILKRPDLIPSMARASRLKAERHFDINVVNQTLMAALDL